MPPRIIHFLLLAFLALLTQICQAEYLYVSNATTNSIGQYQKDGTPVNYPIVNVPTTPAGVAVDSNGNIYVSEYSQGLISKYDSTGAVINSSLIGGLNGDLFFIIISSDGFLYVSERVHGNVKKYNLDGTQVNTFSITGLSYPSGIVTDTSGNLYVAEFLGGRIGKYNATTGATITASFITVITGGYYTVAVDPSGNIYAGNTVDGIAKYNPSGVLISATFATGNGDSYSLLADSEGNIYNGSNGGGVQKYNSSGTLVSNSLVYPAGSIYGLALGTPPPSSPAPASVPTLSEWTQIALAFMTFGLLFWYQKRESV